MIKRILDAVDDLLRRFFPFLFSFPALMQFIKFGIVGTSGVFVDMAVMYLCVDSFGMDPRAAVIPAFAVAATTNYLLNRIWTFKDSGSGMAFSYVVFIVVCALGAGFRILVMHLLLYITFFATGNGYLVANLIGIVLATIFNFLGSKYLAFGTGNRQK